LAQFIPNAKTTGRGLHLSAMDSAIRVIRQSPQIIAVTVNAAGQATRCIASARRHQPVQTFGMAQRPSVTAHVPTASTWMEQVVLAMERMSRRHVYLSVNLSLPMLISWIEVALLDKRFSVSEKGAAGLVHLEP
jgi:hypothetical protein